MQKEKSLIEILATNFPCPVNVRDKIKNDENHKKDFIFLLSNQYVSGDDLDYLVLSSKGLKMAFQEGYIK